MRNPREVRWLTGAALGILLGGCSMGPSTRNVSWEPLPGSDRYSSSRGATLTTDNAADLRARGYVLLGDLTVDQVVERCDWGSKIKEECRPVSHEKDSTADLMEEAARRGGELVWLGENRAERTRETGGTRCIRTKTTYTLTTRSVTGGMEYERKTETVCREWEKYLLKDNVRRSSGILYRLDPPRAAELKRQDEFLLAVLEGDAGKVGTLLDRGFRADSVDFMGVPVLGWAATGRDETLVDLLLSRGAKLEATCSLGTPLNMAAEAGQEGMVRHLMKKGARIDSRDRSGSTPLFNAALAGRTAVVRILLEGGANPDARNDLGNTPLFAAITGRSAEEPKREVGGDLWVQDPEIVRLMLAKGADPKAPNKAMRTPAEFAVTFSPYSEAARFFVGYWFGATGYIDRTGKWAVRPRFRSAKDFHEGLAAVSPKGETGGAQERWGFIDRKGKMVIPALFEGVGSFSQGVAAASLDGSAWGFIDRQGNWAIEPKYQVAYDFAGGLAPVRREKNDWIYIDRQGKQALPETYSSVSSFQDGVARVKLGKETGFIDNTGAWVLRQAPDALPQRFSDGLGPVSIVKPLRGGFLYGYKDKTGKTVIPPRFRTAGDFREGLASVVEDGGFVPLARYIDHDGKVALDRGWTVAGPFSEGVAMTMIQWGPLTVKLGKREVAYIDRKGETVLALEELSDPAWQWGDDSGVNFNKARRTVLAGTFSEGLARVRILGNRFLSLWERKE